MSESTGLLKIQCRETKMENGDYKQSVRSFYYSYFMVCIAILAVFIALLTWLYCNERQFMKQYQKKYRSPSEYTIELRGLPPDYNKQMVIDGVYK